VSHDVEDHTERLDPVGIVAGVCQEAGRAEWLNTQAGESRRSGSVGTATLTMVRHGSGAVIDNGPWCPRSVRTNLSSPCWEQGSRRIGTPPGLALRA
jgi:hypothetical protein